MHRSPSPRSPRTAYRALFSAGLALESDPMPASWKRTVMIARITTFPLAAALLVAMGLGAQRADAATYLGSPDTSAARRRLRLLDVGRRRGQDATLLLRVPKAGRLSAAITRPSDRLTGAGPFLTILTGDTRVKHAGRPTPSPAPGRTPRGRDRRAVRVRCCG
jgi:hypothetical protein